MDEIYLGGLKINYRKVKYSTDDFKKFLIYFYKEKKISRREFRKLYLLQCKDVKDVIKETSLESIIENIENGNVNHNLISKFDDIRKHLLNEYDIETRVAENLFNLFISRLPFRYHFFYNKSKEDQWKYKFYKKFTYKVFFSLQKNMEENLFHDELFIELPVIKFILEKDIARIYRHLETKNYKEEEFIKLFSRAIKNLKKYKQIDYPYHDIFDISFDRKAIDTKIKGLLLMYAINLYIKNKKGRDESIIEGLRTIYDVSGGFSVGNIVQKFYDIYREYKHLEEETGIDQNIAYAFFFLSNRLYKRTGDKIIKDIYLEFINKKRKRFKR